MPRESLADRRKRTGRIISKLRKQYDHPRTALAHRSPLQLLVATILSAQCTDKRVNMVTPALFAKYRTAADYAAMDPDQFEKEIQSTGFFRNKTKSIRAMAQRLVEHYGGEVPDTMPELLTLAGVARKTANVVLGNAFGKNEGIAVDTHVQRLSQRLKLTFHKDPVKIELDLMALTPREDWTDVTHLLIEHGRAICTARSPRCGDCPVNDLCPSAFKV